MPAGAVFATVAHFIYGVGWLQVDEASMVQQDNPPGFSAPMLSLTFDDGSAGFFANGWPIVQAHNFKTTQYIPTGDYSTNDPSFMMTVPQLSPLAKAGQEIGAHSVTHPALTTVPYSELDNELMASKAFLEKNVDGAGTVTDFAYPFGDYDARVIGHEQAAGYVTGRSVEEGYVSKLDLAPYDLRVQNILSTTTVAEFESWVDYAKAQNYWLIVVFHEVQPDTATLGDYDTTVSKFSEMLNYLDTAGIAPVTVRDGYQSATAQIAAPQPGSVKITSAGPTTNQTLTATPSGFTDPNSQTFTYNYQWLVNGTPVSGATTSTFDLSQAGHGDRGDKVEVNETAKNSTGQTSTGVSDEVTVADTALSAGSVAITPSGPSAGSDLTATPSGFADADGDELAYEYTWLENGQPIAQGTGSTLPGTWVLAGTVTVRVTAVDGHGGTSPVAIASVDVAPATGHSASGEPLQIVVSNPNRPIYRLGQPLVVKYSCSAGPGIANCAATLGLPGAKPVPVSSGKKVQLSKTGRYVLRITATDHKGNTQTTTVYFRVTSDRNPPAIVINSPKSRTYRLGQSLLVRFSCRDGSGISACSGTLGRVGGRPSKVSAGSRVPLTRRGRYVLRISARDGVGNAGIRTLSFSVK